MRRLFFALLATAAAFGVRAEGQASWQEIAEKAVREAAVKAAREKAETEASAKATAEAAAKAAAEATVKAAVEKASKEAAEAAAKAAAKTAAEEAAKALTDEKAAKEEAKEAKEEAKEELRQIDTRIFTLIHASAVAVAEKLNMMWNGEFGQVWKVTKMAVPYEESNMIIVTAPRTILNACEKVVRELDVEAKQVYIEARFVQLGNSASHRVGIDWEFLNGIRLSGSAEASWHTTRLGNGVDNYSYSEGAGTTKKGATSYNLSGFAKTLDKDGKVVSTGETSDGSIGFFGGTLSVSQMALTLSALDASGDSKQFANPKIIVSSGKKATVDMTTKYPNVKISAKRTTGVSDSLDIASEMMPIPGEDKMMFAKESFFSWGIALDVTPRVGTNGLINVSIVPTISSQESWVDTSSGAGDDANAVSAKYPVIKVQRLITEFNLASGTTAVIGGLSVTDEVQQDTGIPVLRKIPWIGPRIFGWTERVKEQKEIIVFVTVGIVDPHSVSPDAGLPKNAVLGRQYTKGQKLEPGDRPEKNMEGFDSLDLRSLELQAQDPLRTQKQGVFNFSDYIPFRKNQEENNK